MANTQMEWENLRTRFYSVAGQYCLNSMQIIYKVVTGQISRQLRNVTSLLLGYWNIDKKRGDGSLSYVPACKIGDFELKRSSFFFLIVIVVMLFDDTLLDDGQDDALIPAANRGQRQAQHQIQLYGNPLAAQRGRFCFVPKPLHERRSQKFGVHERVVHLCPVQEGRLIPQQQLANAFTRGLRRPVEQVLDQQKVPDTDQFYILLVSNRLGSASNAFHLTAQEWRQNGLRAQTLLDNLSKTLNFNEQFEVDDSFHFSVVHVQPPPRWTGKKRQHVPGHQSNVRLKQM